MSNDNTQKLIQTYYDAFNEQDMDTFFNLLSDEINHEINHGEAQFGKDAFREFMKRMNHSYKENIHDLVIFTNKDGSRAAAEFIVDGCYLKTDKGLPEANNQTYSLKGGAFFEIEHGKITRITNYYNLNEWLKQINRS